MHRDVLEKWNKEEAKRNKKHMEELEVNPLIGYSTTELKIELKRRKDKSYTPVEERRKKR